MAQKTELSVLSLPGPVHSFSAKEEAAPSAFRLCGTITNEPKYAGTVSNEPKYAGIITNEPKYGGEVSLISCN